MLNANIVPARNLQKSYKSIIEEVKKKKKAVVLTTNNQPQAAIVSLEDLEKLQQTKAQQGTAEMLNFVEEHKEELKELPANLREIADDILYSK
ncbi:type II toxin-antitoxin system Phd/YefM family antitoxin [Candidatus Daviesbacteria bacterium]|nr:type II toxin-antitoxin system Phd/YefM family antitoxin [Candidatus Daviesbacteria bacterium]